MRHILFRVRRRERGTNYMQDRASLKETLNLKWRGLSTDWDEDQNRISVNETLLNERRLFVNQTVHCNDIDMEV